MVAPAGGAVPDAEPMEQAERGVAQQRQDRRPRAPVGEAGVLAQGHILRPLEAVLDRPVAALERQGPAGVGHRRGQAGAAVVARPLGLAVLAPGAR